LLKIKHGFHDLFLDLNRSYNKNTARNVESKNGLEKWWNNPAKTSQFHSNLLKSFIYYIAFIDGIINLHMSLTFIAFPLQPDMLIPLAIGHSLLLPIPLLLCIPWLFPSLCWIFAVIYSARFLFAWSNNSHSFSSLSAKTYLFFSTMILFDLQTPLKLGALQGSLFTYPICEQD